MITVIFTKSHLLEGKQYTSGDETSVSNNVAFGLETLGVARRKSVNDSLVKSEFGNTKAFNSPPQKRAETKKINKFKY